MQGHEPKPCACGKISVSLLKGKGCEHWLSSRRACTHQHSDSPLMLTKVPRLKLLCSAHLTRPRDSEPVKSHMKRQKGASCCGKQALNHDTHHSERAEYTSFLQPGFSSFLQTHPACATPTPLHMSAEWNRSSRATFLSRISAFWEGEQKKSTSS